MRTEQISDVAPTSLSATMVQFGHWPSLKTEIHVIEHACLVEQVSKSTLNIARAVCRSVRRQKGRNCRPPMER